ncbi:MAG TPA: triose-phosphate isomerase [Sphingomonas sp.]|nr:triose-phosphate isomerase [Sphingomonas sp.]
MNGSRIMLAEVDAIGKAAAEMPGVDVAIAPPFTLLAEASARAEIVAIGGQDCHQAAKGAHTGAISAGMLVELGASFVICGHSERRAEYGESDSLVQAKARAAQAAGLTTIICVGEDEAERGQGRAIPVITSQLEGSVPAAATAEKLVIAYEPIWAIGSGRTPTCSDIVEMHTMIRARLIRLLGDHGSRVPILYGGSVNPANAADILACDEVGGVLVGGASLSAGQFVPIIAAGANVSQ